MNDKDYQEFLDQNYFNEAVKNCKVMEFESAQKSLFV